MEVVSSDRTQVLVIQDVVKPRKRRARYGGDVMVRDEEVFLPKGEEQEEQEEVERMRRSMGRGRRREQGGDGGGGKEEEGVLACLPSSA